MRYRLIEPPRPLGPAQHEAALARMVERLRALPGVRAIYQIGGASTPGISDLDMVAVFDDGVACPADPRAGLSPDDRYLFAHEVYGTHLSRIPALGRVSSFHGYRLIAGEDVIPTAAAVTPEERHTLEVQVALEFLVKMYVNMVVQRAYGALKVRGLLLHARALQYDLDFLGVQGGALAEVVGRFIALRARWFAGPAPMAEVGPLADALFDALVDFLGREAFGRHRMYLPAQAERKVGPMVWLENGPRASVRREGALLPAALAVLGNRYFSLQNRLSRFHVAVPFATTGMPAILQERFDAVAGMMADKRARLPHFAVMTSSLFVP